MRNTTAVTKKALDLSVEISRAKLDYDDILYLTNFCISQHKMAIRKRQQEAMGSIKIGKLYEFTNRRGGTTTIKVDTCNIKTVTGHEVLKASGQEIPVRKWKVSPTLLRPVKEKA